MYKNKKWVNDFNVRPKTVKLLEEIEEAESYENDVDNIYFDLTIKPHSATEPKREMEICQI